MKYKRADGKSARPTLVVIDDPQTDESARSLSQCATRESILAGAILGLAGARQEDLRHHALYGSLDPGIWPTTSSPAIAIRSGMGNAPRWCIRSPPTKSSAALQRDSSREPSHARDIELATAFYSEHRDEMECGCCDRLARAFNYDERSAIQHAMNLKLQDEAAFFAEYQNEPLPEIDANEDELTADQISRKFNRMQRCEIPIGVNYLTMFVDVQASLLFYAVAAWESDFTGYNRRLWCLSRSTATLLYASGARSTLASSSNSVGLEGAIYAGLEALINKQLSREWRRDDGAAMANRSMPHRCELGFIDRCDLPILEAIAPCGDCNPESRPLRRCIEQPFSEYKRRPGDRVGHNWRVPNVHGKRAVRHVVFDTNYWKSFSLRQARGPLGRSWLPIALRRFTGYASPLRRAFNRRVSSQNGRPRS